MEKTLTFLESHTIGQFKELAKVESIDIIKNPKTEKLFFAAGNITGAVAKSGYSEQPTISKVQDNESDEPAFWMLHNKSSNNTVDSL